MKRSSIGPLSRLRRWRDFQESRAQAEHLLREGERIGCERKVADAEETVRIAQKQRMHLLDSPELDLASLREGASIEAHAWQAVARAEKARDGASLIATRAREKHLRAREASRAVARREEARAAEDAERREKITFDQIADLLAARRTSR